MLLSECCPPTPAPGWCPGIQISGWCPGMLLSGRCSPLHGSPCTDRGTSHPCGQEATEAAPKAEMAEGRPPAQPFWLLPSHTRTGTRGQKGQNELHLDFATWKPGTRESPASLSHAHLGGHTESGYFPSGACCHHRAQLQPSHARDAEGLGGKVKVLLCRDPRLTGQMSRAPFPGLSA